MKNKPKLPPKEPTPLMKKELYLQEVALGNIPPENQIPQDKIDEYFGIFSKP